MLLVSPGPTCGLCWALVYDAVPPEGDIVAEQRRFNQHYISLKREYLAEPVTDIVAKFADMSERLGMPALVPSYEREVDPSVAVGLRGPLVALPSAYGDLA